MTHKFVFITLFFPFHLECSHTCFVEMFQENINTISLKGTYDVIYMNLVATSERIY